MGQLSFFGSILLYLIAFGVPAYASTRLKCRLWVKVLLLMISPLMLATFRYNVGYDYGSYVGAFKYFQSTDYVSIIKNYESGDPIGYYIIGTWAASFRNERIFFFVLAFASLLPPMLYILREWEHSSELPMILFMYLFGPYIFTFSAIKQGIALGLLIYSLTYINNRNIIQFFICVVLASTFHSTAIVFLPMYFFINREQKMSAWKKIVVIFGTVFVIVNLETVLSGFLNGRFESYATETVYGRNRSFWLYSFWAVMFVCYRIRLLEQDKRNELFIIMMIMGALFNILGFSNAFAKRIGEYFTFAQVFLLPQLLLIFNEQSRRNARVLLGIYIVGMFLIANPTAASGMGFVPYSYKFR